MSDIASISAFKQAALQTEVIFAVARKAQEQARIEGDSAIALLQTAADLSRNAGESLKRLTGPQPLAPGQSINLIA